MHYGGLVYATPGQEDDPFTALTEKVSHGKGNAIMYTKDSFVQPEDMCLEISSLGKGDYREPMVILEYEDGSQTSDFVFKDFEILDNKPKINSLPSAYEDENSLCETLRVTLKEVSRAVEIDMYYSIFAACDCITRRIVIRNTGNESLKVKQAMSLMLDMDEAGYKLTSFGGAWAREMGRHDTPVSHGQVRNETICGVSSNRNNPFVMLTKLDTTETAGEGFAFNLIYSGNHLESAGVNAYDKTRFLTGINPQGFCWTLEAGESFESPEAVMTFSDKGERQLSLNMHHFVRHNVVRGKFKNKPRPILINSWEATYFNISESKLMSQAKKAAEAGIELFVMDDGWFKGRNNDKSSLGDWVVDKKKLPGGIEGIAAKIHSLGLDFGIWVEPEMINEDSDLYRAHPEYAMAIPGRENSLGRNQMNLDLTNPEVVDYIKNAMRRVIGSKGVNYVKWDMNRTFSDVYSKVLPADRQGETLHRYYISLYDIMKTLTEEFPDVLFEGCASGGNRFDLGILSYFPQIWASDDTDAMERTKIQKGVSYGYPMSTMTAHVSACPNHQTLRNTPLDTRYNVASFGVLGYELNLNEASKEEFEEVKKQVADYRRWRETFFFGDFYRLRDKQWMVVSKDKKKAVALCWEDMCKANSFYIKLRTTGLEDANYHVYYEEKKHNIKEFGGLINQVSPIHIKADSVIHNTVAKFYKLDGESLDIVVHGQTLNNAGIKLNQAFGGTGLDAPTRVFQDFASRLIYFEMD